MTPLSTKIRTIRINATDAASPSLSVEKKKNEKTIRVVNDGNSTAFVSIGVGTQVAEVPQTTYFSYKSNPILAGEDLVFSLQTNSSCEISAVCNAGESTVLYACLGDGV